MEINPATWIALATFAGTAIYMALTGRRPPRPPSSLAIAEFAPPLARPAEPSDLASLESAARAAAVRRQEQALRRHHLAQIAAEMDMSVSPSPEPQADAKPTARKEAK